MRALLAPSAFLLLSGCVSVSAPRLGFDGPAPSTSTRAAPGTGDPYLDPAAAPAVLLTEHLVSQCTAEHGFAQGAAGEKDEGLCTGDYAAGFREGYAKGAKLFAARLEVEQLRAEIAAAQRDLWTARGDLKTTEVNLASLALSSDRRALLKAERASRIAAGKRLEAELAALQQELVKAEAAAEAAKNTVAAVASDEGSMTSDAGTSDTGTSDAGAAADASATPVLTPASY